MEKLNLLNGNNIELLKTLEENSVDSIITDPPYGLSFMGKKWDYDVPSTDFWKEVLRVLKPGGHVLSFGGTRTYHRMVVNMEDAGFEIRDQIMWLYGSGFPKSHNIGKAIDAMIKTGKSSPSYINKSEMSKTDGEVVEVIQPNNGILGEKKLVTKMIGASLETDEAIKYEGWGTALKPANEPICLARKPIEENTIAENVLKYSTGGINIDGCRLETDDKLTRTNVNGFNKQSIYSNFNKNDSELNGHYGDRSSVEGRFPANIILECICDEVIKGEKGEVKKTNRNRSSMKDNGYGFGEKIEATDNYNDKGDIHTNPNCPCRILDEQSGINKSVGPLEYDYSDAPNQNNQTKLTKNIKSGVHYSDKGGASRFFYTAKVSKKERNIGLEEFEETTNGGKGHGLDRRCSHCNTSMLKPEDCKCEEPNWITPPKKNIHPTVKPVQLMAYLCRLITPKGGTVLDPFMGSGSTGIAALLEGFNFIGMEMDKEYFNICESRINNYEEYRQFLNK